MSQPQHCNVPRCIFFRFQQTFAQGFTRMEVVCSSELDTYRINRWSKERFRRGFICVLREVFRGVVGVGVGLGALHVVVCLIVCLFVCLSVCLSVCLFVCLFVCLWLGRPVNARFFGSFPPVMAAKTRKSYGFSQVSCMSGHYHVKRGNYMEIHTHDRHARSSAPAHHCIHASQMVRTPVQVHPRSTASMPAKW